VTVARLNSAEAPPIFSRWEVNSGFQGAGVVGVGWEAGIAWRRRREVVVRAARVLNWSVGEYGYCCSVWVFLESKLWFRSGLRHQVHHVLSQDVDDLSGQLQ
jgi:hypothetical protein